MVAFWRGTLLVEGQAGGRVLDVDGINEGAGARLRMLLVERQI